MNPADDIELFLLALISRGLATPYDFKVQAGLSVGTTSPVLARLEKKAWIRAGKPGARGSRRFTITKEGEKALREDWQTLLGRRTTNIDEILRIVYLAWAMGGRSEVAKFIDGAVTDLKGLMAIRTAERNKLADRIGEDPAGEAFQWLKASVDITTLNSQALTIKTIAKEIAKSSFAPKKKS